MSSSDKGYDFASRHLVSCFNLTHTKSWTEQITDLLKLCQDNNILFKQGVVECIQDLERQLHSKNRIFNTLYPPQPSCKTCNQEIGSNLAAHMDMHFRYHTLEARFYGHGNDTFVPLKKQQSALPRPMSLRTKRQLEMLKNDTNIKEATRKRIATQLQRAQTSKKKSLSAKMSNHSSRCETKGTSQALRGWFLPVSQWCELSPIGRVPYDVQKFGRFVSCLHPQQGFWQQMFPHILIPRHWEEVMFLDHTNSSHNNVPKLASNVKHELIVFTDDQYDARTCDICGVRFKTCEANDDAEHDFILNDAMDSKEYGIVHVRCFDISQEASSSSLSINRKQQISVE